MYICIGLVLNLPPENKPRNVAHNIFSELPQNASLLFFRKKINENCNRKILRDNGKLKPNFVENLQRQFSDFSNIKTILSRKTLWKIENRTKRCVTNQVCVTFENRKPNVVDKRCVDFFSSWKYNTAFNSGLKIWRVSGKSEMAQLFNLKFFLYLCWLGVGSSPQFSSRETL